MNARDSLGLEIEDGVLVSRDWDDIYDSIVGNGSAYLGVQGAATWGAFWGGNVTEAPRGAVGFAGVSQGVSEFADDYADGVIDLVRVDSRSRPS